jgi:hypothetical protein
MSLVYCCLFVSIGVGAVYKAVVPLSVYVGLSLHCEENTCVSDCAMLGHAFIQLPLCLPLDNVCVSTT